MVRREELVAYLERLLGVERFRDACPNGLQVEGRSEIRCLVSGVTANQPLLDRAVALGADALLVHHGFFWKGEAPVITGIRRRRLATLLAADINLLAYHLPLDAHPEYGNNVRLAQRLRLSWEGRFGGDPPIGMWGSLPSPMNAKEFAARIAEALRRPPLVLAAGPSRIRRVAWCSGAAQAYLEEVVTMGMDAFVTGEISEPAVHLAREYGIHCFAAGHHATERYGVQALGDHLASRFGVAHHFVDIDSPL